MSSLLKKLSISIKIHVVKSLRSLFGQFPTLSTESVGSRRELVANCVHTANADATKQFRRVGVGGVYWALDDKPDRGPIHPNFNDKECHNVEYALGTDFIPAFAAVQELTK